jgi:hypothetical protein
MIGREELIARLTPLLRSEACLNGTPMVPLHQNTLRDVVFWLRDRGSKPDGEDRADGLRAKPESPGAAGNRQGTQ